MCHKGNIFPHLWKEKTVQIELNCQICPHYKQDWNCKTAITQHGRHTTCQLAPVSVMIQYSMMKLSAGQPILAEKQNDCIELCAPTARSSKASSDISTLIRGVVITAQVGSTQASSIYKSKYKSKVSCNNCSEAVAVWAAAYNSNPNTHPQSPRQTCATCTKAFITMSLFHCYPWCNLEIVHLREI